MASHTSTELRPMIRRARVVLAGLLLALGVVVLPTEPAEAATHQVVIKQYAYGPSSLNVTEGDTVTWTNRDDVQHDVVVTDGPVTFRSPLLSKGKRWSYTFTKPGSYSYTCSLHPDMRGSVKAKAQSTPATSPSADGGDHKDTEDAGKETAKPEAEPSASPTAVPASTAVVPAAQQTATLNPFLLLLGASTAVVVFSLLLMASRPQGQPVASPEDDRPSPST